MATLKFSLLIFFFFYFLYASTATATATAAGNVNTTYLREKCGLAPFKQYCYKMMKSHAAQIGTNDKKLTTVSLELARNWTESAQAFVIRFSKKSGLRDNDYDALFSCWSMLNDSMTNLDMSLSDLKHLGDPKTLEFKRRVHNLQNRIDLAQSGAASCKDQMADISLHNYIRVQTKGRMNYLSMVLGNSMTLFSIFVHGT